jgi:RNA polymerase sigma factor (sigma-70 family)
LGRLFGDGTASGLTDGDLLRRFARGGDESAFEALAARHGGMVLGVCRRLAGDGHAAEDAFQATFLVLARRAGTLGGEGSLGPWLHGVARRVATRARQQAARRRSVERPGVAVESLAGRPESGDPELRAVLDEEIGRLPPRYRAAIVLCYLEGLTHEEAAHRLGCPLGTVRSRVARARDRLRDRLTRRGVAVSTAGAALAAGATAKAAPAPPLLLDATRRAAARAAAGVRLGAGSAPEVLAGEVHAAMVRNAWKAAIVSVLALGVGVGMVAGAALALHPSGASRQDAAPARVAKAGGLRAQVEAAVKAVADVPIEPEAPRNETPQKIYNLIQLGTIQAGLGDEEGAKKTMRLAFDAAQEIPTNYYRSGALARLGKAQASVGDEEGARASIALALEDDAGARSDVARCHQLAAIASAQARLGDKDGVRRTLDAMRAIVEHGEKDRGDVFFPAGELVWATARAGLFDEAYTLATDPPFPIPVFRDPEDADAEAEDDNRRDLPAYRERMLRQITEAVIPEHGEAGRALLRRVSERARDSDGRYGWVNRELIIKQSELGDAAGALASLETGPLGPGDRAIVLPYVAQAQLKAGDRDAALDTLRRGFEAAKAETGSESQYVRFEYLALAQVEAGDFAGAVASAEAMGAEHAHDQVAYLMRIARAQDRAGDAQGADATRARARVVAEARRAAPVAADVPRYVSLFDEAGRTIEPNNAPSLREDYGHFQLAAIAADLGEYDEARRQAEQVHLASLRRFASSATPAAMAAEGDMPGAVAEARRLEAPEMRLWALSRIATGLAERAGLGEEVRRALWP